MIVTIMECTVRMVLSHCPKMIQTITCVDAKKLGLLPGESICLPKSRILDHIHFVTLSLFQTSFRNNVVSAVRMDGVYDGKHFYSKNLYFISLAHKKSCTGNYPVCCLYMFILYQMFKASQLLS